jgi:hypothetical protein
MAQLPIYAVPLIGFAAGFVCFGFFSHWLRLVLTAMGKHRYNEPAPDTRQRGGAAAFLLMHPVTWILVVGVPWGIYQLLVDPPSPPWLLFWLAAVIGVTLPGATGAIVMARLIRKAKRRGVAASGSNAT